MISLNIEKTLGFISKENVFAYEAQVKAAQEALENGTGKGNDFLGWLHLPSSITKEHLADLKATAQTLRDNYYYLAVVTQRLCGSSSCRYWRKLPRCTCGDRGFVKQLHLVARQENGSGHSVCRTQYR